MNQIASCRQWFSPLNVWRFSPLIIEFVRQHQLQHRSTYLIIHLATVDLLVGGVSLTVFILQIQDICFQWDHEGHQYNPLPHILRTFFPLTSLVNLAAVSLERVHATFFPFRHRFIKKWVYGVALAGIWLMALLGEAGFMCLIDYTHIHFRNIWLLSSVYHVIVLLIITLFLFSSKSDLNLLLNTMERPTEKEN